MRKSFTRIKLHYTIFRNLVVFILTTMIFFSKQKNGGQRSSSTEACVSILGLFVAVGVVGGLAALIYGL